MTMNSECWDDGRVPPTNECKRLPEWLRLQLTKYVIEGDPFISGFLYGALCNDLMKACEHGDAACMACLKDLSLVIFNRIPLAAWGSKEKVKAWQDLGGWHGYRKQQRATGAV